MPKLPEEHAALKQRVDDLIRANEALGEYLAPIAPEVFDHLISTGLGSFAYMHCGQHGKTQTVSKLSRLIGAIKKIE